jgi:hypothetical protein
MYEVSFFPILVAGLSAVVIGFGWYHPRVFGAVWMRLAGVTPEMAEKGKRRMVPYTVVALLAAMIVAYVMNYFGIAWGVYDWIGAIELAFWIWIGFVASTSLGTVLWDHKPIKLYFINAMYWLLALIVMACILVF